MSCCRCNRSGKCRSCVCVKSGKRCTTCLPARRGNCQNHMVGDAALSTVANDQENEPRTNEITTPGNLTSCPREEEVPLSEASENCESDEFLPCYILVHDLNFRWGELSGEVDHEMNKTYEEVVHWRWNLFKIPSGRQGKAFVQEMVSLFQSYVNASAREKVALKAAMVLPALVLQKPSKTSKSKDHIWCMERRHSLWQEGNFKALLEEGRASQGSLQPNRRAEST